MLMGLGLVFYGMGVMGDTMKPLRSYEPFVQVLATMDRPLFGILAGVLFTALVQSSAATVGLAIAMASEGLLSLDAGIALALGANVGTCATALLASIGKPVEAVRAATVHVMFNVLGVVLWLPLIGVLGTLATAISPSSPELDGTARLAAEVPRQIANANTLFNVLNTLFFIGFTGWFARITTRLVPDRGREQVVVRPKFLDPSALDVPTVALEQVRQELGHVGDRLQTMLHVFGRGVEAGDRNALASLSTHRTDLATLDNAILEFLSRLRERAMTRTDSKTQSDLMTAAVQLSAIGDLIVDELVSGAEAVLSKPHLAVKLKHATTSELYQAVHRAVAMVTEAVRRRDAGAAKEVEAMSPQIRRLADEMMARLVEGWNASAPENVEDLRLQTALVDNARQIFTLTKRIARTVSG
jgi:phosphate:Na+ symporter